MRRLRRTVVAVGRIVFITGAVYVVVDVLRGSVLGDGSAEATALAVAISATVVVLAWPTFRRAWRARRSR